MAVRKASGEDAHGVVGAGTGAERHDDLQAAFLGAGGDWHRHAGQRRLDGEHPSSHLIVARPADTVAAEMASLIDRLIDRMQPRGAFATTLMKVQSDEAVHCAFEQEREALRFAGTMSAKSINRYIGWETQCAFTLDKTLADAIARALER